MADETAENRQLLLEKYSFTAEDGKKYTVYPAKIENIIDGTFTDKINRIGIPNLEKSPRIHFILALNNENKRQLIKELAEQYIYLDGKPISFEETAFTVDDLILVLLRLAGISG